MKNYILIIILLLFISCDPLKPTTDIKEYENIIKKYDTTLTKHFPKTIDEKIILKSKLYYSPSFLQGGGRFQVLCEYTNDFKIMGIPYKNSSGNVGRIQKYFTITDSLNHLYSKTAKLKGTYKELEKIKDKYDSLAFPTFLIYDPFGGYNGSKLPEDFILYFNIAEPQSGKIGSKQFIWNHGTTSGAAISVDRNLVLYWVDSW